ncbi:MAG: EAL domain-containing protein [Leptolyngbya sp. DLM2.Bin15]|nr:MAG: EAL domain-containing protein [Leptolyngbya sp. DLM2.Bin15]
MQSPDLKKRLSMTVPFAYAFWSSLWILLSDRVLLSFGATPELLVRMSILKGWLFTLVTSVLLYLLIRRGERSLRTSYALLSSIIEGTTDAIFVKDLQGRYGLINTSGAQRLGKLAAEIIGTDDRDYVSSEDFIQLQATDRAVLNAKMPQQLEETVTMQGQTVTYLTTKYPLFNVWGEVEGLIGISRDITERQRMKQEREALLQELQGRNRDLEALNLVTANAISTLEIDALLHVLLDRLVTVMAADLGLIFLVKDDDLVLAAHMGDARSDGHNDFLINREIARIIRATGQLLDIQDLRQDPRFSTYSGLAQTRHVLGVPLKRQQQFVGILQVEWHQPHVSTDREVRLLEITAERCAMALINAQLFERTQHLQQRLQLQFDRSPIACIICDRQGRVVDWNPAAIAVFGYSKADMLGKVPDGVLGVEGDRGLPTAISNIDRETSPPRLQTNGTKDGRTIFCEWHHTPLRQANGEVMGTLSMVQDVTARLQAEEQLRYSAFYDALTQLPQRRLLQQRIQTLLDESTASQPKLFAIFHLDLVRFKVLKYSLGHQLAEQLLMAIATRLQTSLPAQGMLSRVGTDEFAILHEAIASLPEAMQFAEDLQRGFSQPFSLGAHTVFMQITLGFVLRRDGDDDSEALLQAADIAMHHARLKSSTGYAAFDLGMRTQALDRLRLDSEMHRALDRQDFQLHYQPIIQVETRQLIGFEALLRWRHHQAWISPVDFIPLAEETGFIVPLGTWVLRQACTQLHDWHQQFPEHPRLAISVNVSVAQLMQPDFLDIVDQVLQETGLSPTCLKLEVTETAVMENAAQVSTVLEQLKARHIRLCIDDFGTGYSSLSYLRTFPFDTLKVDRSFVISLEQDPKSLELIRMIRLLARSLGMDMVAEGVETQEQLQQLQSLGCEAAQGYLISRPIPSYQAEEAIALGEWPWPTPL